MSDDLSNIIEIDFSTKFKPTPITKENVVTYQSCFSAFNQDYEKIHYATIGLANMALQSQFDIRKRGARAQISLIHEPKVTLRHRYGINSIHAYLHIHELGVFAYIGEFDLQKNMTELVPKPDECRIWEDIYHKWQA